MEAMVMDRVVNAFSAKRILLATFIEGIVVMAVEILAARMVSPAFGTSITTWSFVLGITLFGLASGYFAGGFICKKKDPGEYLGIILKVIGILLALLPLGATKLFGYTISLSYYPGLIISLLLILLPAMFLLGMLSPMLVHLINRQVGVAGLSSGRIFSISTLGGIIGSLLFGLFMLPTVGISISFYILGSVMFLLSFLFSGFRVKAFAGAVLMILIIVLSHNLLQPKNPRKILYSSEGLLGQVKVVQSEFFVDGKAEVLRIQLINNTLQGMLNMYDPSKSYLEYQSLLRPLFKESIQSGDVLVLGLGAGLIYHYFGSNEDLHFDFVEIDEEVAFSAQKFFMGDERRKGNLNIIVDDARHYIEANDKEYDFILVDTFAGENVPAHVLTLESLQRLRRLLTEEGLLVINFHGNWSGEKGRAARSLYRTITVAGYETKVAATSDTDGIERSLLFLCSESGIDHLDGIVVPKSAKVNEGQESTLASYYLDVQDQEVSGAEVLTDDKQQLEYLLKEVCLDWRRYSIKNYVQPLQKESGVVFY